jgi:hypothetical protein
MPIPNKFFTVLPYYYIPLDLVYWYISSNFSALTLKKGLTRSRVFLRITFLFESTTLD